MPRRHPEGQLKVRPGSKPWPHYMKRAVGEYTRLVVSKPDAHKAAKGSGRSHGARHHRRDKAHIVGRGIAAALLSALLGSL